ncbi:META domain-containing protein [Mycolicibacterium frederiksbergense]|uniref:META domain-containing protein n=1 Tax=Mycolicibacterium frederiksbergense TaxID=117567 RepID=A0A6H0SBN6_9MYCO|nr:META domain-containing protein [Mycolicibacterium frederiksbergense]QIV85042.1 META domain-containing protein [Mycolicibacterium frederiksbergense]
MRLIVLLLAALVTAGCASTVAAEETSPEGRTFVSVSVAGEQIPGGGPLTLSFADGQLSAYAGCNRGSGPVDLADGHLSTRLATTMMGCPPPYGDADAWMGRLLEARPAWSLSADTLTLTTDAATVTLRDKAVVDPDRPLVGTTWRVESLVSADAVMTSATLEQVTPTLTIGPDQAVTGWTGCHTFYARAEVTGSAAETVTFGPINVGGPVCPGEIGDIEQSILRVLDGSVQAVVDADQLRLTGADGNGLLLRAE